MPLHALGIQEPDHVHATNVTQDTASSLAASLHTPHDSPSETPEGPPSDLLGRLDHAERTWFLRLWQHVPPHVRLINFALDAPGWDATAIDTLSSTLQRYADVFSSSKLDYGKCSVRPFEIKVPLAHSRFSRGHIA